MTLFSAPRARGLRGVRPGEQGYGPAVAWLPDDFVHPNLVELATGQHLRPIREADTAIDYPAVMGSRNSLWATYGARWNWPPATMTFEQDRVDLARHEREIAAHESFNYCMLDADETVLIGCIYIDPPETDDGHDAEICWWVVDDLVGGELEALLDTFVPRWIADEWPFTNPKVGLPDHRAEAGRARRGRPASARSVGLSGGSGPGFGRGGRAAAGLGRGRGGGASWSTTDVVVVPDEPLAPWSSWWSTDPQPDPVPVPPAGAGLVRLELGEQGLGLVDLGGVGGQVALLQRGGGRR